MKRAMITLGALAIAFSTAQANAKDLSGSEIKGLISGKKVLLATSYGAFPLRYARNGRVSGDGTALGLARFFAPKETGSWWVSGTKMCQKFPTWYYGKSQCFRIKKINNRKIRWIREDGFSGTATISG